MRDREASSGHEETEPVGRVAQLLKSELGARRVMVWLCDEATKSFQGVADTGSDGSGFLDQPSAVEQLSVLFAETLLSGLARAVNIAGSMDGRPSAPATLFVIPVLHAGERLGVVVTLQTGEASQAERDRQLSLVELRSLSVAKSLVALRPRALNLSDSRLTGAVIEQAAPSVGATVQSVSPGGADTHAVIEFLFNLQRSLDLDEVAGVAVNDGRLLCGADRVSLALRRGRQTVISAVSGQESVHPRGNLIRAMTALADQVVRAGEPLKYDGTLNEIPPQVAEPLSEFVQEGGARFLLIVPLFEPPRLVPPDPPAGSKPPQQERRTLGVYIIEQMQSSEPAPQLLATLKAVSGPMAAALYNARSHSSLFLLPVWRTLGRLIEWLRGRRLVIAAAVLASLIVFGVALFVVPWEYRVDAKGRLMPIVQREVFAPWDGQVVELLVQGGERVTKGQLLARLRNDELSAELVKIESGLSEKRKLLSSLYAQRDDAERQANKDEATKLEGKASEVRVEISGVQTHRVIIKDRLERLTVLAPIEGVVTTFQVEQLLVNRPVKRGDVLMQVMDETGDWHLELEIAEHRVGRILNAQQARAANNRRLQSWAIPSQQGEPPDGPQSTASVTSADGNAAVNDDPSKPKIAEVATERSELEQVFQSRPVTADTAAHLATDFIPLEIEYRLLTQPDASYTASLSALATRIVSTEQEGSILEAKATLNKGNLPIRSIGAEVRARIGCGPSCLGDVLFGDVTEFCLRYLWW